MSIIEGNVAKEEKNSVQDLQIADAFGWLLNETQVEKHGAWVKTPKAPERAV
jgi:hypothetical protein